MSDQHTQFRLVPKIAGSFSNFQQWVNKGQSWLASPDHRRAMCVDSLGRRCAIGADFMRARDDGSFPVYFFWECEPRADTELAAARALLREILEGRDAKYIEARIRSYLDACNTLGE